MGYSKTSDNEREPFLYGSSRGTRMSLKIPLFSDWLITILNALKTSSAYVNHERFFFPSTKVTFIMVV